MYICIYISIYITIIFESYTKKSFFFLIKINTSNNICFNKTTKYINSILRFKKCFEIFY